MVTDQARHKPNCTTTVDVKRLEISDSRSTCRGIVLSLVYVVKTKALISCAVTTQLIWIFVFPYAKSMFSHDEAHLMVILQIMLICQCNFDSIKPHFCIVKLGYTELNISFLILFFFFFFLFFLFYYVYLVPLKQGI